MQSRNQIMLMVLAAGLLLPGTGVASGSYTARPPRPAISAGGKIDSAKYDLGKRIYTGKAQLGTVTLAAPNGDTRLRSLQASLPDKEQKKTDLTALTGKLSAEQLDALEYYVAQRFPKK